MAIAIIIDGVDHTADIVIVSLRIAGGLTSNQTASCVSVDRTDSTSTAYRPLIFDSYVVTDGAATLFNGTIASVKDQPIAPPRIGTQVVIEATGHTALDRILVNESYVAGPTAILNSAVTSPTSLTVVGHGLVTGQRVLIEDHEGSTPDINGEHLVTVTGPNNVTIAVNVTVPGGGGTIRRVVTLEEVVNDLWATYLSTEGITLDGANPTGPTIEAPVYDGVTVRAAFQSLQGLTGHVVRVTPANVLQLFAPGGQVVPYSLTAANRLNVGPVTWDKKIGQYANSLLLKYGTEVQTTKTDIFTGTGAINAYDLTYVPVVDADGMIVSQGYVEEPASSFLPIGLLNDITISETSDAIHTRLPHGYGTGTIIVIAGHVGSTPDINGTRTITVLTTHSFTIGLDITVAGNGGTFYRSDLTWHYYPPSQTMYRIGPVAAEALATFAYQVQFPQSLTIEDAGEIAANGLWQAQRTVTTIFERDAAQAWGEALLRRSIAQGARLVTTQTFQAMPLPGDTITLTFTDKLVSGAHLITDVSGQAQIDKRMLWTITGVEGTEAIDNWMDLLREQIGSGTGGSVGGGGGVVSGGYIPPTTGGGPGAASGTVGTLAKFITTTTVGDSLVTESGAVVTVAGTLAVSGALRVTEYLELVDGLTPPAAQAGRARVYIDTSDGDVKIIFGDGTIRTIVTDN